MRAIAALTIALVACSNDASCPQREEPGEIAVLGSVPRGLTFEGIDRPVQLDEYHSPCQPKLLLVRTSGAWCGTCLWHAAQTRRMLAAFGDRVSLVDLVVSDEDNAPPTHETLVRFAARVDGLSRVASDPGFTFAPARLSRAPLPDYAIVDARTMRIVASMENPDPVSLEGRIRIELAIMDGAPVPAMPMPPLVDDRFTEDQIDLVREMRLVPTPPPDPTNAVADDPRAASLGRDLFEDIGLSPARISCVKCHDPGQEFTDGLARSRGVAEVDRNAPPIALAAHSRWQFWDGRADTLWSQALGPIEDAREMGSSRAFVAQRIASVHRSKYEAVFGPLPPEVILWPSNGKPGDAAYDALSDRTKDDITRVLVGVGKAIAAFERSLRVSENALDRYAAGDHGALTSQEKDGLLSFFRQGCAQCHFGPRLTNDAFHVLRFGTGRGDGAPDLGREAALTSLRVAEFGASTRWSDAPRPLVLPLTSPPGAFKTPTLRGLPGSAPYGHGGTLATLADVSKHYGERGLPEADPRAVGRTEEWVPLFDVEAQRALVPFLDVLTARIENR
jgi:cytochrome c peroxidase